MAKRVYAAIAQYTLDNNLKRKSDCAPLIGISETEFYAFFKGNKILDVSTIQKISDFTKVNLDDAKVEYLDAVDKFMEEKGL